MAREERGEEQWRRPGVDLSNGLISGAAWGRSFVPGAVWGEQWKGQEQNSSAAYPGLCQGTGIAATAWKTQRSFFHQCADEQKQSLSSGEGFCASWELRGVFP